MFCYLEFSDRLDYNPISFFNHVKIGGVAVPASEQQDAHEFLNFFFSRL